MESKADMKQGRQPSKVREVYWLPVSKSFKENPIVEDVDDPLPVSSRHAHPEDKRPGSKFRHGGK